MLYGVNSDYEKNVSAVNCSSHHIYLCIINITEKTRETWLDGERAAAILDVGANVASSHIIRQTTDCEHRGALGKGEIVSAGFIF